jgi:hypothetical protein
MGVASEQVGVRSHAMASIWDIGHHICAMLEAVAQMRNSHSNK